MRVLVTGASGFVGRRVVAALAKTPGAEVIATDLRVPAVRDRLESVDYRRLDICEPGIGALFAELRVDVVVHLAAIVTPGPHMTREMQRRVDVDGTRAVLDACLEAGVERFVYTSSGAAYGYHADASPLLEEDDPLRGNDVFAYACHKREVEELLAEYREDHPELAQVIFRVSTVLGPEVDNQITAMFERPVVMGLKGSETPFCFVAAEDVAACIVEGALGGEPGVYNLTGDGVMTLREIAARMGRRYVALPEAVVRGALRALTKFGLSPYGPEQTLFLKYRPVLSNERLKRVFGYRPRQNTRQAFERYRASRALEQEHG
ncbi:MAG: SDR family oxidoreductase [Deltaproteobacteria bacterium]|nr:SDR family oxidoreductase [Deltaproteobacteria bacterium]